MALGYRLLTQAGARSDDVGVAPGTQGIGLVIVRKVILWIALSCRSRCGGFSALYLLAAMVGAVLLVASAASLTRPPGASYGVTPYVVTADTRRRRPGQARGGQSSRPPGSRAYQ
jgi:hypothetical protein